MSVEITWDQEGLMELAQLAGALLDEKGQQIIDAAAPPVDTGFLRASGYVHSERMSTFNATWASGVYGSKRGSMESRQRVEAPAPPPALGAVVGWAAIYTYWADEHQPFIYPALLSVAEGNEGASVDHD